MKKLNFLVLLSSAFLLAACGNHVKTQDESSSSTTQTTTSQTTTQQDSTDQTSEDESEESDTDETDTDESTEDESVESTDQSTDQSAGDSTDQSTTDDSSEDTDVTIYTVYVGDALPIVMTDITDTADKGEDTWIEQYMAIIDAEEGDVVTFAKDLEDIAPGASGKGNNLYFDSEDHTLSVRTGGEGLTLYLKVYANGYDTWLDGFEGGGEEITTPYGPTGAELVDWYIVGEGASFTGWSTATGVQMWSNPNSADDKGCILNITIEQDDVFKVTDGNTWYGYERVDQYESPANLGLTNFTGANDGQGGQNFKCTITGVYDIYVNKNGVFWIQAHSAE